MSAITAHEILPLHSTENGPLSMNFASILNADETIAGVTSVAVSPTGPTPGTPQIQDNEDGVTDSLVTFRATGMSAGQVYTFTVTVMTSDSSPKVGIGKAVVE